MHPLFTQASGIIHDVIGAAIEVHKDKGPGLMESVYEWCLMMELGIHGYKIENQSEVIVRYKQFQKTVALNSICWSIAACSWRSKRWKQ